MGSSSVRLIVKPKIAMISGEGTSSLSYGATWHFFEQQLHYPVTSINSEDFGGLFINTVNYDFYSKENVLGFTLQLGYKSKVNPIKQKNRPAYTPYKI